MEWYEISTVPLGRPVLITDGSYIVVAIISKELYKDHKFIDSFGFGGYEWDWDFAEEDLTHWAELPELPKDGR